MTVISSDNFDSAALPTGWVVNSMTIDIVSSPTPPGSMYSAKLTQPWDGDSYYKKSFILTAESVQFDVDFYTTEYGSSSSGGGTNYKQFNAKISNISGETLCGFQIYFLVDRMAVRANGALIGAYPNPGFMRATLGFNKVTRAANFSLSALGGSQIVTWSYTAIPSGDPTDAQVGMFTDNPYGMSVYIDTLTIQDSGQILPPPLCTEGEYRCSGYTQEQCHDNSWAVVKYNSPDCGYVEPVCVEGDYICDGYTRKQCQNNALVVTEQNSTACGYVPPECEDGEFRCNIYTRQECQSGKWVNIETNSELCGYTPGVSDLDITEASRSPSGKLQPESPFDLTFVIKNSGTVDGTSTLVLSSDNIVIHTESVSVKAGESKSVTVHMIGGAAATKYYICYKLV